MRVVCEDGMCEGDGVRMVCVRVVCVRVMCVRIGWYV